MCKAVTRREEVSLYGGSVRLSFNSARHSYEVNDGSGWFMVPSVTQILRVLDKSAPLMAWASRQAVDFMRSRIIAGTAYDEAQLTELFSMARSAFRSSAVKAQDIGTMAHDWIRLYILSLLDHTQLPAHPTSTQVRNSCQAAVAWMEEVKFVPMLVEEKIYSKLFRYAGTIDAFGVINGHAAVVDWKTSKAIYPEYRLQVSAYAHALAEMDRLDVIPSRWVVRIDKETGAIEANEFERESDGQDFLAFTYTKELSAYLSNK